VLGSVAVLRESSASGSQRSRSSGSSQARQTSATGTPIVFDAPTWYPSGRSCSSRSPRARSYSTVTVCAHQPGMPCSSPSRIAISACVFSAAPASSRTANHSSQPLPVFSLTALSPILGIALERLTGSAVHEEHVDDADDPVLDELGERGRDLALDGLPGNFTTRSSTGPSGVAYLPGLVVSG
jgi:hypothetical protein